MTFRLGIDIGLATVAVIAVAIAVMAVLSSTGDVSEGNGLQDGPHLGGDGVITHPPDDDPPIENRRRFIQQGERIDGVCRYTTRVEGRLGGPAKFGRVLAENPNTCEQLVEEGTLSEEGKRNMEEEDRRAGGAIATVIPKQAENGDDRISEEMRKMMREEDLRRAAELGITVVPKQRK